MCMALPVTSYREKNDRNYYRLSQRDEYNLLLVSYSFLPPLPLKRRLPSSSNSPFDLSAPAN